MKSSRKGSTGPTLISVAEVAQRLGLKKRIINKEVEYYIPLEKEHPYYGFHGIKDAFILLDDGTAWDAKKRKSCNCREVAELAGICKEEYEPWVEYQADEPPSKKMWCQSGFRDFDCLTSVASEMLAQRGISEQTKSDFHICAEVNAYRYPTWHPNGLRGQFRKKAFSSKAIEKYWWSAEKNKSNPELEWTRPLIYNAWNLQMAYYVVLVSSEVDVWTLHEIKQPSVSMFSDEQDYDLIMSALKGIGITRIYTFFKNDAQGHSDSVRARDAAIKLDLDCEVHVLSGVEGLDLNDIYAQCEFDKKSFRKALKNLPTADEELLQAWRGNLPTRPTRLVTKDRAMSAVVKKGMAASPFPPTPSPDELEAPPSYQYAAEALFDIEFSEPQWVIPNFLGTGLGILGGKTKMYKSWMCLDIAIAVASGGTIWDTTSVAQGEVLYLALEDNPRRLQDRLRKILANGRPPHCLDFWLEYPNIEEGNLEPIKNWLKKHKQARLIIIDTLEKLRAQKKSKGKSVRGGSYSGDYDFLSDLKRLADQYGVAILLVHHLRKSGSADPIDNLLGTSGIPGVADTIWVLDRKREEADASLFVTGRDILEQSLAMHWNKVQARWVFAEELEPVEVPLSQERQEVLRLLEESDVALEPKAIAQKLKAREGTMRKLLRSMVGDRQILQPARGLYTVQSKTPPGRKNSS